MSNIKITHPGGASGKLVKDGPSNCILPRGSVFTLDEHVGDFYRVLVPFYVHVNSGAEIHDLEYTPSMIPWVSPPFEKLDRVFEKDGGYWSIHLLAKFRGIQSSAPLENYATPDLVGMALRKDGINVASGIKYFPEPPFIAWVKYYPIRPLGPIQHRKKDVYILVLAIDEHFVTVHDSLDVDGGSKRIPINDFLLGYKGTSIWLQ